MTDNEGAFLFSEIKASYNKNPAYFDAIFSGKDKNIDKFKTFYDKYVRKGAEDTRPLIGLSSPVNYSKVNDVDKKRVPEVGKGRFAYYVEEVMKKDIVDLMRKNPQFENFISNLNFNSDELLYAIETETCGFKVPEQFALFAESLFKNRKGMLEHGYKRSFMTEKGV